MMRGGGDNCLLGVMGREVCGVLVYIGCEGLAKVSLCAAFTQMASQCILLNWFVCAV